MFFYFYSAVLQGSRLDFVFICILHVITDVFLKGLM